MGSFEALHFEIQYEGNDKKITAKPHPEPVEDGIPLSFEIAINGFPRGKIKLNGKEWQSGDILDKKLIEVIGEQIRIHYSNEKKNTFDA